jgi:hypothetical protein
MEDLDQVSNVEPKERRESHHDDQVEVQGPVGIIEAKDARRA